MTIIVTGGAGFIGSNFIFSGCCCYMFVPSENRMKKEKVTYALRWLVGFAVVLKCLQVCLRYLI